MKITKTQLKQIIKEELKATLNEDDQMAKAQELAQVFAQSPEIMAAVKLAAQEPEVLDAISGAGALSEYDRNRESWTPGQLKPGQTDPMTAKLYGGAAAVTGLAAVLSTFPPIVALGITGGVALTAIGILVGWAAGKKDSENV